MKLKLLGDERVQWRLVYLLFINFFFPGHLQMAMPELRDQTGMVITTYRKKCHSCSWDEGEKGSLYKEKTRVFHLRNDLAVFLQSVMAGQVEIHSIFRLGREIHHFILHSEKLWFPWQYLEMRKLIKHLQHRDLCLGFCEVWYGDVQLLLNCKKWVYQLASGDWHLEHSSFLTVTLRLLGFRNWVAWDKISSLFIK